MQLSAVVSTFASYIALLVVPDWLFAAPEFLFFFIFQVKKICYDLVHQYSYSAGGTYLLPQLHIQVL